MTQHDGPATVTRSSGDIDEVAAGYGIGYFHQVWDKKGGLSRNILGGSSTYTNNLAAGLGDGLALVLAQRLGERLASLVDDLADPLDAELSQASQIARIDLTMRLQTHDLAGDVVEVSGLQGGILAVVSEAEQFAGFFVQTMIGLQLNERADGKNRGRSAATVDSERCQLSKV